MERRPDPYELEEGQTFESPHQEEDSVLGSFVSGSLIERKVIRSTTSEHSKKKEIEHRKDIGDKIVAFKREMAIHKLNSEHRHIVEKGRLE